MTNSRCVPMKNIDNTRIHRNKKNNSTTSTLLMIVNVYQQHRRQVTFIECLNQLVAETQNARISKKNSISFNESPSRTSLRDIYQEPEQTSFYPCANFYTEQVVAINKTLNFNVEISFFGMVVFCSILRGTQIVGQLKEMSMRRDLIEKRIRIAFPDVC